jgi:hypothetical protein
MREVVVGRVRSLSRELWSLTRMNATVAWPKIGNIADSVGIRDGECDGSEAASWFSGMRANARPACRAG